VQSLPLPGELGEPTSLTVPCRIELDSPPTYEGALARIAWTIELHVDVPWAFDVRASVPLRVQAATIGGEGVPRAFAAPRTNAPFVELAVEDDVVAPGSALRGAYAVGNLDEDTTALDLAMIAIEAMGSYEPEGERIGIFRDTQQLVSGRTYPLLLGLPRGAPVSFATSVLAVRWSLVARFDGGGDESTMRVPIEVRPLSRTSKGGELPLVGAARWEAMAARVAARHGLSSGRGRRAIIVGDAGSNASDSCAIVIEVGTERPLLGAPIARLDFAPLGLGLVVERRKQLEGKLVVGRDRTQTRNFFDGPLLAALRAFDEVAIDDARARVATFASAHDEEELDLFVGRVVGLAKALGEARARMPPPTDMRDDLRAWRAYRDEIGGRLEVGRMAIVEVPLDGATLAIETLFDDEGEPSAAAVSIVPRDPLLERLGDDDDGSSLGEDVHTIVTRLRATGRLVVEPARLAVTLSGAARDPAALRPSVVDLRTLSDRLGSGTARPYR
jgi:hypothetical protein